MAAMRRPHCDVLASMGCVGDGVHDETACLQRALSSCAVVELPGNLSGGARVYLSGSLQLLSDTTLLVMRAHMSSVCVVLAARVPRGVCTTVQ